MGIEPYSHCNFKILQENCTPETCCLAQSHFNFLPNYGANLFFTILWGAFIVPHLALGVYYKTWGFAIGMIFGLALELVGYAERVVLHDNPFLSSPFLTYLVCVTIAPVFISAAIYLSLTRIVVVYGDHNSRFRPRTIAITFMTSDFMSLVLQAAGGAVTDLADDGSSLQDTGVDIMIAGLVLQAVSLAIFLLVLADFAWRCKRGVLDSDAQKYRLRQRTFFKAFLAAIVISAVCILIRSIYRAAELWQGFGGSLWNNETDFLVLDGAMISFAVLLLTIFHPAFAFAGGWDAVNWSFRKGGRGTQRGLELQNKTESSQSLGKSPVLSMS